MRDVTRGWGASAAQVGISSEQTAGKALLARERELVIASLCYDTRPRRANWRIEGDEGRRSPSGRGARGSMRESTRRSSAPRYDAIAFTGGLPDAHAVVVAVQEVLDPSARCEHGGKWCDSNRACVVAPWLACSMLRVCDRRILWLRVRSARRSLVKRSSTTTCSSSCWWATAMSASKRSWAASRTVPPSRRSAAAAVKTRFSQFTRIVVHLKMPCFENKE